MKRITENYGGKPTVDLRLSEPENALLKGISFSWANQKERSMVN